MKCENCGLGFVIAPINVDKVCPHCGHIHGDLLVLKEENNMLKKIWKTICAPFKHVNEFFKRLVFWNR